MSIKEALKQIRMLNRQSEIKKGKNSELKVDAALNFLAESGKITTSWNASGTEDRKFGIDKHVQLPNGTMIDLQVKSSRSGVDVAKQKFPYIPVIEVIEGEETEDLAMRLYGRIQAKLKGNF